MTPESFSKLCDLVGGPLRMANLIGSSYATIRRKLNGESKITRGDELKIRQGAMNLVDQIRDVLT